MHLSRKEPNDTSDAGHGSHHPEGGLFAVVTRGKNGIPPFRPNPGAKKRWLVVPLLKTLK